MRRCRPEHDGAPRPFRRNPGYPCGHLADRGIRQRDDPTVGIVNWSVSESISAGHVEYGRGAQAPEYVAPVELGGEGPLRTLLLGLKEDREYVFRVVATGCDGQRYVSPEQTLRTGFLPNRAPRAETTDHAEGELYAGFTLSCNGYGNARQIDPNGESSWAYILDADDDLVWAYDLVATPVYGCNRARMSADGRYMWTGNSSFARPTGALRRITMDGLQARDYSLPARHHDFTILPSGNVLYVQQQNGAPEGIGAVEGSDEVMELDPETGESTLVYDQTVDFAAEIGPVGSHTNFLSYVPQLEAFSFSLLYLDMVALVSYPQAELLGVFGGVRDEFGVGWDSQHGHHFVDGELLVFNNWVTPSMSGYLEFSYDRDNRTTSDVKVYVPEREYGTIAFGDVQRLANGNTLVTFSSNGVYQELGPNDELLRETIMRDPTGFATRRASLYGPPPHLGGR